MTDHLLLRWRRAVASEAGPPSTTRLVLLVLSIDANLDGGSCFPSTRRLAAATNLSRTSVMKHLDVAERAGWIQRSAVGTDRGQGWKRNVYRLTVPKVVKKNDHEGGQRGGPRRGEGGQPYHEGGQPHHANVVNVVDHTTPETTPETTPDRVLSGADGTHTSEAIQDALRTGDIDALARVARITIPDAIWLHEGYLTCSESGMVRAAKAGPTELVASALRDLARKPPHAFSRTRFLGFLVQSLRVRCVEPDSVDLDVRFALAVWPTESKAVAG